MDALFIACFLWGLLCREWFGRISLAGMFVAIVGTVVILMLHNLQC